MTVQDPDSELLPFKLEPRASHLVSQILLSCQIPLARVLEKHILTKINYQDLCLVEAYFKCNHSGNGIESF